MIIGAMNNPKKNTAEEIMLFGEMGFDFAEITLESPSATPERIENEKKGVQDALNSYNFGVLCHLPWYFSVAHPYQSIQKAIDGEAVKAFNAAVLLGAKKVTIHTEFLPAGVQERPVKTAKTIETVKRLCQEAEARGLELLVENAWARSFSIREFKMLFAECGAGMTLDAGHASTSDGEGFDNYAKEFRKRIRHVHLHDNDGRSDLHLPLGAGRLDIPRIVKQLKSFYDGTVTLEAHSEDRDYLRISREKLEIMWYGKKKFEENKGYLQPDG